MAERTKSMVRMLREMSHWMDDRDDLVIECEGYELDPYSIEIDEYEGKLIIKCWPPEDGDILGAGDDDEEEEATGTDDTVPWKEDILCDVPERPIETLDISDDEPKEG